MPLSGVTNPQSTLDLTSTIKEVSTAVSITVTVDSLNNNNNNNNNNNVDNYTIDKATGNSKLTALSDAPVAASPM